MSDTSAIPDPASGCAPELAGGAQQAESSSLLGGSALFFGGRIAGAAATYGTQVFLARWIGAVELGRYVEAFAWCLILSDLALLGFPFAGLRFIGETLTRGDHGRVRGFVRRTRAIVTATSLAVAVLGAVLLLVWRPPAQFPDTRPLLVALACLPALTLLRHFAGIAHAFTWFTLVVIPMTVLRPLLLLVTLLAVWAAGYRLLAEHVVAVHAGVVLVLLFGLWRVVSKRLRARLRDELPTYTTRVWMRTSTPLLFVSLFNSFFPEINVVVLGLLVSDGDVAVFNASIRTAFLIGFFLYAVDQSTMPRVSALAARDDWAGMQHLLVRATRMKFAVAVVAAILMIGFGRRILAVFGDEFTVGYSALLVLALGQVVRAAIGPVGQLLGLTGHHDKSLLVAIFSVAALVAGDALLVPHMGILGGALSAVVVTILANLWMLRLVARHVGVVPSILSPTNVAALRTRPERSDA